MSYLAAQAILLQKAAEIERDEWKCAHDHVTKERNSLQERCDESARIIEDLRARVAELEGVSICQWWENCDGDYQSSCGEIWTFSNDAGLAGNNFNFCHKCGNVIEQIDKEPNHG